jgi:hypothetical protein
MIALLNWYERYFTRNGNLVNKAQVFLVNKKAPGEFSSAFFVPINLLDT